MNLNVPYREPDGLSQQLWAEVRARYGSRAQNLGFVTGYMDAARAGQTGGHFADVHGITHAIDLGVDIDGDGAGLLPGDAMELAEYLRELGAAGRHPFTEYGYLIHDMSTTTAPRPLIAGFHTSWKWDDYEGASPHSDHIHITTGGDQQWGAAPQLPPAVYNSREPWGIERGASMANDGAMRPVPEMYGQTQGFKDDATIYNYGAGHGAIDYGTPSGTPIVAPEDGIVDFADWVWNLDGGPDDWTARDFQIKPAPGDTRTGGGIALRLRNSIGSRWWHCHLSRTDLNPGDRVQQGQIIGYTGNTGSSTGPHLHLSLLPQTPNWANGYFGAIDPTRYLTKPYRPRTYTAWQGAPTEGVGASTVEKDWFDMASLDELDALLEKHRRKIAADTKAAVIRELTYEFAKEGGVGGKVSIRREVLNLAGNFARVIKGQEAIARAVSPSNIGATVKAAVADAGREDINTDELAAGIARQLLVNITEKGAE